MRTVDVTGPSTVVLRSIYEARGVHYQLQPASRRTLDDVPGPDVWEAPLVFPDGAKVGDELTHALHGRVVPMDCGLCSATGTAPCPGCNGDGRVRRANDSDLCGICAGSGSVGCRTCSGSGGLVGHPTIWARIEAHEEARAIGTDDLPLDVAFDLTHATAEGQLVHRQEGPRVLAMRSEGGYRDGARSGDAIARTALALCEHPGVPEGTRIVSQSLEVRRVPVFVIQLEDGRTMHVWGDPPRVSPARAMDSLPLRALRASPWAAASGAGLAAAAWWWLFG